MTPRGANRLLVSFLAGFVAALAAGCSGADEKPLPRVASAVATRDVVDGEARLSSTVVVTLDRDFDIADSGLPLASLFELSVPKAEGSPSRVLVTTAERTGTNGRTITLTTGSLIPEGSKLTIQRKAFTPGAVGEITAEVESDLDPALVVLASRAFVPTLESFFANSEVAPVNSPDRDPTAMRAELERHLAGRGSSPGTTAGALKAYDEMSPEVVPSPKLRAALAALTGTFAEPAVASLLTADNCTQQPVRRIVFQPPPGDDGLVARVTFESGGARIVSVNPYAEGERIEHLMPILAHEAIHCDQEDGIVEEVAATAFDGFLYLQLLRSFPDLATAQTKVARELNIDAVALVNSGRRFPESLGVLKSPGVKSVLPLTNVEADSFAAFVAGSYPQITTVPSPPERVAGAYADALAEGTGFSRGQPFDMLYLDELIARATDGGVLAAALDAFELVPM